MLTIRPIARLSLPFALPIVAWMVGSACAPCKRATAPEPVDTSTNVAPETTTVETPDTTTPNVDAPVGTLAVGAPCGPGLGDCDATSFCRFPADAPCGDGGVAGVCEARPVGCHRDCPGVCGCDGQRFCNSCVAEARGFSIRHKGSCQKENHETP
jgi:hypothetical protein